MSPVLWIYPNPTHWWRLRLLGFDRAGIGLSFRLARVLSPGRVTVPDRDVHPPQVRDLGRRRLSQRPARYPSSIAGDTPTSENARITFFALPVRVLHRMRLQGRPRLLDRILDEVSRQELEDAVANQNRPAPVGELAQVALVGLDPGSGPARLQLALNQFLESYRPPLPWCWSRGPRPSP